MNYWQQRMARESNSLLQKQYDDIDEALRKYFLEITERLKKEVEAYYGKILSDSPQDAVRTHQLMFGRQFELYNELSKQLVALGNKNTALLEDYLVKYYQDNYDLVVRQNGFQVPPPNMDRVRQIVNGVWVQDGKNWSQRVWINLGNLQNSIQKMLTDAVVTGISADKLTEQLMNDMNVGYYEANRLARTELAHVRIVSSIDSYKDAGVTRYKYLANGPHMCKECEELNGKEFDINDTEHLPPQHPFAYAPCLLSQIKGECKYDA